MRNSIEDQKKSTQADLTAATDDELRRRASEGDSAAFAELNRRRAVASAWSGAA